VIRRLLPAFLFCAAALHAQDRAGVQMHADQSSVNFTTGESVHRGNVWLRDHDSLLTADQGTENFRTRQATATGHVVLTRGSVRLLADSIVYNEDTGSFTAEHVRLGNYPYYAEGDTAVGTRDEITISHARVTYGEPGPWQPTLSANSVTFAPGRHIRAERSQVGVGHVQPLPFPQFQQALDASLISNLTLTGGYRPLLGVFADAGLHVPVANGVRLGADVGIYTSRGVMVGPSGNYANDANPAQLQGDFHSGYINDHGDKKTDILGRPVPEDRAYVEWHHQQLLTENLSLNAQFNWWRDSEVVRDFRPRAFFPVQEPDTFVESVYTARNYLVTAFARFQPNSFEHVLERLPEIRFDLLPTPVGGGIYEQFSASYVRLRERGPLTSTATPGANPTFVASNATLQQADRFDAYYGLSRPIAARDWFAFTPVVGGRLTHYANPRVDPRFANLNQDLYPLYAPVVPGPTQLVLVSQPLPSKPETRTLGEIGFDAVLRGSGTFAYKNEAWNIDGLRHLVTPRVSYRYIQADKKGLVPEIDRPAFSTYLQPLGLSDTRAVDTLRGSNTLRLALENVLQARDPVYGSRDLAALTVANDFGFKPGHRDLSGLQFQAALMPASWLQFDTYQRYTPRHLALDEFNTGFTVHDGRQWSVGFSNNFLRHQLNVYAIEAHVRLNEAYDLFTRLNYDARKRRFNEQAYGVTQNLGNTWLISYLVSLYSGPRRESHFGFSVQIDTVRF
jgi:LPS-assembly protein